MSDKAEKDQIRNRFSSASRIEEVELELGEARRNGKSQEVHFIRQDACDIAWSNLVVKGKGFEKEIIKNINGYVPRGSLMAIMGSSGAGKSTLMNVLAGRNLGNLTVTGAVSVNGHLVEDNMPVPVLPEISAYVQQDDIFIGSMTVREQLVFHAALRMSHKKKSEQIDRVEHVIEQMGLTKCKDTVIGIPGMSKTISGGEMKRLSFATEILTDPPIIFCDEPTSGLDSYLAETVIRTLKTLSQSGTTILCTIHQPSSQVFDLFSHLLLLAQGKVAFLGPTAKTPRFFEKMGFPIPVNFNPCDHYINHIALIPGREEESYKKMDAICQRYSITKTAKKNMKMVDSVSGRFASSENLPKDTQRASTFVQLRWLFWRAIISHYRDTTFAAMKVIQNLGTAIFIGLLFLRIPWDASYDRNSAQTVTSALFVMVTSYSMCYLFLVLMAFPLQVPVIRREHYGGHYTIFAAFFAEVLAGRIL